MKNNLALPSTAFGQRKNLSSFVPYMLFAIFACLFLIDPALAQTGGVTKVTGVFTNLQNMMHAVAAVVATCALMWCGYKFLFGGARIQELFPVIGGAILIAAAAEIVGWVFTR